MSRHLLTATDRLGLESIVEMIKRSEPSKIGGGGSAELDARARMWDEQLNELLSSKTFEQMDRSCRKFIGRMKRVAEEFGNEDDSLCFEFTRNLCIVEKRQALVLLKLCLASGDDGEAVKDKESKKKAIKSVREHMAECRRQPKLVDADKESLIGLQESFGFGGLYATEGFTKEDVASFSAQIKATQDFCAQELGHEMDLSRLKVCMDNGGHREAIGFSGLYSARADLLFISSKGTGEYTTFIHEYMHKVQCELGADLKTGKLFPGPDGGEALEKAKQVLFKKLYGKKTDLPGQTQRYLENQFADFNDETRKKIVEALSAYAKKPDAIHEEKARSFTKKSIENGDEPESIKYIFDLLKSVGSSGHSNFLLIQEEAYDRMLNIRSPYMSMETERHARLVESLMNRRLGVEKNGLSYPIHAEIERVMPELRAFNQLVLDAYGRLKRNNGFERKSTKVKR